MQYLLGGDCLWLGLPVTRDEGFSVFAISDASVSSLADALCSLIECSPTWDWLGLCLSNDFWLIKKQSCFKKTKQTFLKCIIFHHPLPVLGPNGPEILRHARTNFWSRSYLVVKYKKILYCSNTYCDVLIFLNRFIEPNSVVCWMNINISEAIPSINAC